MTPPSVSEVGRTGLPMLTFDNRRVAPETSVRKVLVDWVLALVALILLSPAFLVIAIAIRAESRAPVFFRQTRVGRWKAIHHVQVPHHVRRRGGDAGRACGVECA